MGGMCLGSLLLPKKISDRQHPLRVYGYIELGIGALGLVVLFAIRWSIGCTPPSRDMDYPEFSRAPWSQRCVYWLQRC